MGGDFQSFILDIFIYSILFMGQQEDNLSGFAAPPFS